jgi:hypothetical protein
MSFFQRLLALGGGQPPGSHSGGPTPAPGGGGAGGSGLVATELVDIRFE